VSPHERGSTTAAAAPRYLGLGVGLVTLGVALGGFMVLDRLYGGVEGAGAVAVAVGAGVLALPFLLLDDGWRLALTILSVVAVASYQAFGTHFYVADALALWTVLLYWARPAAAPAGAPRRPAYHVAVCALAAFCALALASAFWASDSRVALKAFGKWAEFLVVYVTVAGIAAAGEQSFRRAARAWLAVSLVSSVIYLVQWLQRIGPEGAVVVERGFGYWAAVGLVGYGVFLLASGRQAAGPGTAEAALGTAVCAPVLLLGFSRGAWAAFGAACATLLAVALLAHRRTLRRAAGGAVAAGTAVAAGLAVLGALPGGFLDAATERLASIDVAVETASNLARWAAADLAFQAFAASPALGIGAGNMNLILRQGVPGAPAEVLEDLSTHEFFLEVAAELGLVGLLIMLVFLGGHVAMLAARDARREAPWWREITLVLAGGFAVFLVFLALGYIGGFTRIYWAAFLGLIAAMYRTRVPPQPPAAGPGRAPARGGDA
jgi:hypothetical protein